MSSAFNGRVTAAIRKGASIKFIWEGAWMTYRNAAILKGDPNTANAQKLFAFLNRAQIAAGFTEGTGYPGPNTHQMQYLPAEWILLLSIDPKNASKVIPEDGAWLAAKRPDGQRRSCAGALASVASALSWVDCWAAQKPRCNVNGWSPWTAHAIEDQVFQHSRMEMLLRKQRAFLSLRSRRGTTSCGAVAADAYLVHASSTGFVPRGAVLGVQDVCRCRQP